MRVGSTGRIVVGLAAAALPLGWGVPQAAGEESDTKFAHADWQYTFTDEAGQSVTCSHHAFVEFRPSHLLVELHADTGCDPWVLEAAVRYTDPEGNRRHWSTETNGAFELSSYTDAVAGTDLSVDVWVSYHCNENVFGMCGTTRHLVPK